MRYNAKVDAIQPEVILELRIRRPHWSIHLTHRLGGGFPDFVVGTDGINCIFELKQSEKGRLTKDERKFHDTWKGQKAVVWNAQQVIDAVEAQLARLGPGFRA